MTDGETIRKNQRGGVLMSNCKIIPVLDVDYYWDNYLDLLEFESRTAGELSVMGFFGEEDLIP